eukprot:5661729-Lingulodinium_polyedra.AAC.1
MDAEAGLRHEMSFRVLAATLVRYQEHRAQAMASALLELGSKPEEDRVMTLRVKWDETEQNILMASPLATRDDLPPLKASARKFH